MSFRPTFAVTRALRPFTSLATVATLLWTLLAALAPSAAFAALTGTKNIPGDYATLAAAIADLNTQGVGAGGVTLNVVAGNPQTAPSGGYVIGGTGSLVLTTTSSTAPVTIQGNGNTITAFGGQTAGNVNDAIFKLIGADWITISGCVMQENAANTTTTTASNNMTEWAVALLHASTSDGCQNNTIQNNTISLNRTYTNTWGVYANNRHSASAVTTTEDIVNNTTGPQSNNKVYGNAISNVNMGIAFIGCSTAANQDAGNDIGGTSAGTANTLTNWGGAAAASGYVSNSGTSYGIFLNHQTADNISYNSLTSAAVSGTSVTFRGILKDYTTTAPTGTFTSNITNNTVTLSSGFTSGTLEAIRSQGMSALSTATLNINNNTVLNCAVSGAASSSALVGLVNSSAPGTLNMTGNVIRGNTSTATTGGFTGISNTGAVVTAINITNNQIGNSSGGAIAFSAATSGAVTGITNTGGATTAALTVTGNDVRGILHSVAGTSAHTYIINSATTLSQNISSNTFTNLSVSTSGSVTFISNNVALTATGSVTANNNSIVTAFAKPTAGGTVTLYLTTTSPSSATGATKSEQNNNFSNITLTGATVMAGWTDLEGSPGPNKTINGNTFSNWACGSSAVTVIQTNWSGTGSSISNNTISNITGTGAITAISFGSSNGGTTQSIANNTISTLTSSGTGGTVLGIVSTSGSVTTMTISGNVLSGLSSSGASSGIEGIQVGAAATVNVTQNTLSGFSTSGATAPFVSAIHTVVGTTVNITRNKIYDISASAALTANSIFPLWLQGGTTVTATNNLIGDLRMPAGNGADVIHAVHIPATATLSTYNLYDNTIYLAATSTGANFGTTGVYHNTSTTSTTAALNMRNNVIVNLSTPNGTGIVSAYRRSSTTLTNYASTSNNNVLYAGAPAANRLLFYDGTNADQTLAAYKSRVAPRDAASVTESAPFLSTTGSSTQFLHIDPSTPTQIESGAAPIAGITDDFDGDLRNVSTPDIGADEGAFTLADLTGPAIAFTAITSTCSTSPQTLTASITDPSGVPTSGIGLPVLYWKINAGAYTAATGTFVSGNTYSFGFGSGVVAGDVVSYYVVAQDNAGTPNMNSQPAGASGFTANPPAASTPPASPSTYTILQTLAAGTYAIPGAYATLTAAVADYNTKCLGGAVVFELAAGYSSASETFPIIINANSGASAVNTLTIRPASGQTPTISGSLSSGALLKLNGADYVTIDGSNSGGTDRSLTITNTATTAAAGIWIASVGNGAGATNDVVKNCVVSTSAATTATAYAIAIGGATLGSAGGDNDNVTVQNNAIASTNIGLYANGNAAVSTGGMDNLLVSGNAFTGSGTTAPMLAVQVQNALAASVTGNTVNITNSTSTQPVGISLEANVSNSSVTNNRITGVVATNTGGYAGRGITIGTGTTGANITVANNFVAGVNGSNWNTFGNSSAMGIGIGVAGNATTLTTVSGGVTVYHNSVSMTGSMGSGSTTAITTGLFIGSGASAVNVRNNIFSNTQTGTATTQKNYAVYSQAANTAFAAFSSNDYYVANSFNAPSAILGFLGSDQTTLSALNLAFTGSASTTAYNALPGFTSTTDLHIPAGTSSTLESAGASGTGITADIDSDVRPGPAGSLYGGATANDIGADEFDGVPPVANDIAAAAFISPLSGSTMPTGIAFTPQASFTNFGTAAQTNVQVRYRIVDPGSTEIYNDVATLASIAPSATVTVSFPSATLASGGTHTIFAAAELAGDQVALNDEISGTLVGVAPLSGTYLVGVGQDFATLTAAAAAANAAGVSGAVEFMLTDATYPSETFPITFNAFAGASSTNTLWIHPKGGVTSTISGSSATSILKFNGADWITLDGSNNGTTSRDLTIANTNTATTSAVIWLSSPTASDGATHNTLKNLIVTGNTSTTTLMGVYSGGSSISTTAPARGSTPLTEAQQHALNAQGAGDGGPGVTAALTANSDNSYVNNKISKATYGLFLLGTSSSVLDTGTLVSGNAFGSSTSGDGFFSAALWAQYQQGAVITGNDFQNVTQTGTASADFYGVEIKDCKGLSFTSNALHGMSYAGTSSGKLFVLNQQGSAFNTSGSPSANLYANNTIYGLSSTSTSGFWALSAINTEGGYGDRYYDNSVSLTGTLSGGASAFVAAFSHGNNWVAGAPTNIDVRGNILSITGSAAVAAKMFGQYVQGTTLGGGTLDYNDVRAVPTGSAVGYVGHVNSLDYSTLAAWRTASGQESHSLSVDPLFVSSSSDLHIAAPANGPVSPVANAGTPLAGVTTDANGETRNASTPDIGADEFATFSLATSASNGAVLVSPSQPLYNPGSTVTLTAVANVGYVFSGWSGDASGLTNPLSVTIDADKNITANFTLLTFSIVSTTTAGGSITPLGTTTVNYGDNVTFSMVNDPHYHPVDVLVDGVAIGQVTSYDFLNVTANHTIDAIWAIDTYTISAIANAHGSISPAGNTNVPWDGSQTYTITPDPGYHVSDVLVDAVSVGAVTSYTFSNVNGGHGIEAFFAENESNVIAAGSDPGCVTPASAHRDVTITVVRTNSPVSIRGFSVDVQLSPEVQLVSGTSSITEGTYLSNAGSTVFEVIDHGSGLYTVDGTILGLPCGATAASGDLFHLDVTHTGTSGTGTVTVASTLLRDCDNANIVSSPGAAASLTIDLTPVSVAAIAAQTVAETATLTVTPSATTTGCATAPFTWSSSGLPSGASVNAATGEFTWTPDCHAFESGPSYGPVTLTLSDAAGNSGSASFSIAVTNTPGTVHVDPIADQTIGETFALTVTPAATLGGCAEGPLAWSGAGLPSGASVNPSTGVFTWTPDCTAFESGPNYGPVTLTAQAATGETGTASFAISVSNTPGSVVVDAIAAQTVAETFALSVTPNASALGCATAPFTWTGSGLPSGASVNPSTGEFTWTPDCTAFESGPSYGPVTLTAQAATGETGSASFSIDVTNTPGSVTVDAIAAQTIAETATLTVTPNATALGCATAPFTWSGSGLPSGASVNPSTGEFTWTPDCTAFESGPSYGPVTFTAQAATGETGSASFSITVTNTPGTVHVDPIADQTIAETFALSVTPSGTLAGCAEGPLAWSGSGLPSGASVNPTTGEFTWTPDCHAFETGPLYGPVTVTAQAATGETGSASFSITVTNTPGSVSLLPVFIPIAFENNPVGASPFPVISGCAEGPLTWSITGAPAGSTFNTSTGLFTWTPDCHAFENGPTYGPIVITAQAATGETGSVTFSIPVANVPGTVTVDAIADQTIGETFALSVMPNAVATGCAEAPITWSGSGLPSGASVNPSTGEFTWTPD